MFREIARPYNPMQSQLHIPLTFSNMPKFKGDGYPIQHIHAYKEFMEVRGLPKEMLLCCFAESLEEHPRAWYFKLDPKK